MSLFVASPEIGRGTKRLSTQVNQTVKCYCQFHHKLRITDCCSNITSLFALFVFLLCRLTSGAFTIDSSTPTLTGNLNEHPIYS
jgi:hypothetical protein